MESFFSELNDTFFFQIHRIQKSLFRHTNRLMHESGIDLQVEQFPVLMTVSALKSVSQREIAELTMRDKSSIQRSVTTLQRKGLIDVVQDGEDKRKHVVTLTAAGNAIAKKVRTALRDSEDGVFSHMSKAERETAILSAKSLADQLDRM